MNIEMFKPISNDYGIPPLFHLSMFANNLLADNLQFPPIRIKKELSVWSSIADK